MTGVQTCALPIYLNYFAIRDALKNDEGFLGTIEFYPQEGKYHYDGHRNCKVVWNPLETRKNNGLCSVCGRPVRSEERRVGKECRSRWSQYH